MHPRTNIFKGGLSRAKNFQPKFVVKTHWTQFSIQNHVGEQDTTLEEFHSQHFAELAVKQRLEHGMDGAKGKAIRCEILDPVTGKNSLITRKSDDKSYKLERTMWNLRELAFAEHWADENIAKSWLNFGGGTLQDNLTEYYDNPNPFGQAYYVKEVTKRERMIVATIIQWLGTNCGFCFLEECLKKCGYRIVKA